MADDSRILRLPQSQETPVTVVHGQGFVYRFAYARAAETRDADDTGQDYLVTKEENGAFIFALCDGVSQSFYGHLAARLLGDALVSWLSHQLPRGLDAEAIGAALAAHLRRLTRKATDCVQKERLPEKIPTLLRSVLEEKRDLGSESTFVCGRIDLPSEALPKGRVVLAWMGDSRLRLWDSEAERTSELGGSFETFERWSSCRGLVEGRPHIFVALLQHNGRRFSRVMAYSDGLAGLDSRDEFPTNEDLEGLIERASASSVSDDISFLDVSIGPVPPPERLEPLAEPQRLAVAVLGERVRAAWRPVRGADIYEVEVLDGRRLHRRTIQATWESPEMEPGFYRVRVRAWRDEEPGRWSAEHSVVVPDPSAAPAAGPRFPISLKAGPLAVGATVMILVGLLAGFSLAVDSPLHKIVFGPTPTATSTRTPTLAFTQTGTPTATRTQTTTPTLTSTPTLSSTSTQTPTATATNTPTATPGNTPTATQTSTPTREAQTADPTPSGPAGTPTPIFTPEPPTPTVTPSSVPAATPVPTETAEPTVTPSPTRESTEPPTETITPTPEPTEPAEGTETATATSSLESTEHVETTEPVEP